MEALLSRYRNLSILLVVVLAQLLYLGYQVRTNKDERLIRVWAVTTVTPMAGIVEALRHGTIGFLEDYFILLDVREQNRQLHDQNSRLRMENIYFRNQLATAEHARALSVFQAKSPSKTVAARVIGNSTVSTAKAVFIDRGSTSGIQKGMAVVTPEGIVGKVTAVYALVSQVLLVTDPTFKVGIESQKNHIHGVLDCGAGKCIVQQIQSDDKVDVGEWFFTSGEDRIFPKGFPVGKVATAQAGQGTKDIKLNLSGAPGGAEEVLVVLEGIHQQVPTTPIEETMTKMLPPPPPDPGEQDLKDIAPQTQADKIRDKYKAIGKEQEHVFGAYGSSTPNFNIKPAAQPKQTADLKGTPSGNPATPRPAPVSATPAPVGPAAVLGSRPGAQTSAGGSTSVTQQAPGKQITPVKNDKPAVNSPVLPLGAPRHKTATPPQPHAGSAPQ